MKNVIHVVLIQFRDIILSYLIGFLVTYVFAGNRMFTNFEITFNYSLLGFFIAFSLWKGNQFIGWIVSKKFPWNINPSLSLTVNLSGAIVYSIIAISLVYFFVFQFFFQIDFFERIGSLIPQMIVTLIISLLITATFYIVIFFKWWRIAAVNEEKLRNEAIQLRYDALKSNVNPHFLFNSLSVLTSLVDTDPQKAKQFINQFSNIYRYVLENRESELVSLTDEMDFIIAYANLHQIRHGSSLTVEISVNDHSGSIVPLSLQILLENCIKHNIVSEELPLFVKIWRENGYVIVENNIQKRKTVLTSGNGIGLETISKQYSYFTDRKVEIVKTTEFFTVKLPILTNISK